MLDTLALALTIHAAPGPCVVDVAIIPGHPPIVGCIAFGPAPTVLPPAWGGRVVIPWPVHRTTIHGRHGAVAVCRG